MSVRKSLIAANWKMHKLISDAESFIVDLQDKVKEFNDREVLIIPPFTALKTVSSKITRKDFFLGAQNCHWEEKGAFTGEISVSMLKDVGCTYVLVGHSERRNLFGEIDSIINKKLIAVLQNGLKAVLCVGELLEEREANKTFDVVESQIIRALAGVKEEDVGNVVIAYEPVWAIGTGRTASPSQAQEVHEFIRKKLEEKYNKDIANSLRILYGGSVKPNNVDELMKEKDIDGLLVGGASLEAGSFKRIIEYVL